MKKNLSCQDCDFYKVIGDCDGYCDGKLDNVTSPTMVALKETLLRIGYKIGAV